ncbi:MAG: 2-oxoglutarate dehydrogenase complex E2 component, partial [Watsoniomyces obsoletus]
KIDVSVNAPEAGTITEFLVSEGDTVTVDQEIAKIEPGEGGGGEKKEQAPKEEKPAEPKKEEQPKKDDSPPPPPKKEDKPAPPKEEKKAPPKPKEDKSEGVKSPMGKGNRNENRVKMNRMRLRIAERLKQSQNTAASLTTFNEVDMTSIMEFRKLYKDE